MVVREFPVELLNDLFWDDYPWAGYGVVALFFLLLTIGLVLVGLRLIKKGSPPAELERHIAGPPPEWETALSLA